MHLDNGLAAPYMASVHGAGWVGGGVVYLPEPVTSLMVGCYIEFGKVKF